MWQEAVLEQLLQAFLAATVLWYALSCFNGRAGLV